MRQFGRLAVHAEETPGRALACTRHRKRRHSSNIFERLWFAVRGNQFRTSDEDHLVGPERAHYEIGILQWWLAYPHSDVEPFVDDVDAAISGVERDTHSRMLGEEAREDVVTRSAAGMIAPLREFIPLTLLNSALAARK